MTATHTRPFDIGQHIYYQADVKEAGRRTLRMIREGLNKGMDAHQIWEAYKWNSYFLRIIKQERNVERFIALSDEWHWWKNRPRVMWDLLNQAYAVEHSKSRRELRSIAPLLLTLVALHTARDANRKALMAYRYVCKLVQELTGQELDPKHLGRKWEALAKKGYVDFQKGQQGGSSSRLELLSYDGPALTADQRLEAAELILRAFKDSTFKTQLASLLRELAKMTMEPAISDDETYNAVADLASAFKSITTPVAEERRAERLIESVDFSEVVETVTERVSDFTSAGRSLTEENFEELVIGGWRVLL